jgi:hypothetical protein
MYHDNATHRHVFMPVISLLRCIYIYCRKKNQSPSRLLRKMRSAEFLDGAAQIVILTVIFQSIAAKFCSRALFRHAGQNLPSDAFQPDDASAKSAGISQLRAPGMPVAKT